MKLELLNKHRVKSGLFASNDNDRHGFFFIPLKPGQPPLKVLSSGDTDKEWYHVSVSLPNRTPTWEEMCKVKEMFYDDDAIVVQYHPPKKDYINNHPFCLHLWENKSTPISTPHWSLVGVK